jgi:cytochrome P450
VPTGVTVEIPAVAVNSDPALFPHPMKFDGLRFYRLREEGPKEVAAHQQFGSVGLSNLAFGYGRHACPGHVFAANEIKLILKNVLLNYDTMLAGGATERYPNIEFAHMISRVRSQSLCLVTFTEC